MRKSVAAYSTSANPNPHHRRRPDEVAARRCEMNFGQRSTAQALAFSLRSPRAAGDETALYYSRKASKSPSAPATRRDLQRTRWNGPRPQRRSCRSSHRDASREVPVPTRQIRLGQTSANQNKPEFALVRTTTSGSCRRARGAESGHVYERWRRGKKNLPRRNRLAGTDRKRYAKLWILRHFHTSIRRQRFEDNETK